jgi:N-acylneuraminate cytidylyltransferase
MPFSSSKPYVVSIIPARSGSKGIRDKNLQIIGGKTLLEWTILASIKSEQIDRTIVSTDSEMYAELCRNAGAEVPFIRPADISGDKSTDFQFISHAMDYLESEGKISDLLVHLRPTTPLRDPETIDKAVNEFKENKKRFSSLRSVHEMGESAYKTFEISENGNLQTVFTKINEIDSSNNARQNFPKTFVANGYVDVLNCEFISDKSQIHGDNVKAFLTEPVLEVDTLWDLELIQMQVVANPNLLKRIQKDS